MLLQHVLLLSDKTQEDEDYEKDTDGTCAPCYFSTSSCRPTPRQAASDGGAISNMAAPATGGATPAPVKVLVVGQINGRLDLLAPRVAAVHAQHGPFDVVLAVGGLFSVNPAENQPIEAFIAGEKKCRWTCEAALTGLSSRS